MCTVQIFTNMHSDLRYFFPFLFRLPLHPHNFHPDTTEVNKIWIISLFLSVFILSFPFLLSGNIYWQAPLCICPPLTSTHTHTHLDCWEMWQGRVISAGLHPSHTGALVHIHTHTYVDVQKHIGGCGDLHSVRCFISPPVCVCVRKLKGPPNWKQTLLQKGYTLSHTRLYFLLVVLRLNLQHL